MAELKRDEPDSEDRIAIFASLAALIAVAIADGHMVVFAAWTTRVLMDPIYIAIVAVALLLFSRAWQVATAVLVAGVPLVAFIVSQRAELGLSSDVPALYLRTVVRAAALATLLHFPFRWVKASLPRQ